MDKKTIIQAVVLFLVIAGAIIAAERIDAYITKQQLKKAAAAAAAAVAAAQPDVDTAA